MIEQPATAVKRKGIGARDFIIGILDAEGLSLKVETLPGLVIESGEGPSVTNS